MGLTYQQAKELGIDHLHPAASGGRSKERELLDQLDAAARPASKAPNDGMNKLERSFAEMLETSSVVFAWWREPFRIRLAGHTIYKPDFLVSSYSAILTFVEIKGFMRDDAAVKLKVAAETYPCFRWLLVRREGRHGWDVREVTRTGIGREPIEVPWIHGG